MKSQEFLEETDKGPLKIIRAGNGKEICPLASEALTEATRHLRVAIAS